MRNEIVVYGLPAGEVERYKECILAVWESIGEDGDRANVELVKAASSADGWHSHRVWMFDWSPPDWAATVNL